MVVVVVVVVCVCGVVVDPRGHAQQLHAVISALKLNMRFSAARAVTDFIK